MLSLNFHRTFIPERRLIYALLKYVASGKKGTLHQISAETGIPMGKSTGKMQAIFDYCRGMGLITIDEAHKKQDRRPVLTPFGETVYANDGLLGEELTQWLVHLNLCRPDIGAVVWHKVFVAGTKILGFSFTVPQLEAYLTNHYGHSSKGRTGPLLSVYTDDAALGRARVLQISDDNTITRKRAPIISSWAAAYSALMLELLNTFFPGQFQVTLTDFAERTGLFQMCSWQETDVEIALSLLEKKGFVSIDRQIRPWIIEGRANYKNVWPLVYAKIT